MRYYELIYIVNSNTERKKNELAMKEISKKLEEAGSKIINHIIWGKKKLAYPIKGNTYGTYLLAHYQGGNNDKLHEFDSWIKLSDLCIRHMIVRLNEKPDVVENLEEDKPENDSDDKKNEKRSDEKNLKKEENKDKENKEAE